MSLFPFMRSELGEIKPITTYKEYEFDFGNNTLTGKILEGKAALKMWIYKALLTSRYTYPIYSWDYGQDLDELIGQGYEINLINDTLHISFTAERIFGEVTINV
ncbi:MAG: DUF2634 domain-containing protein [Cellulosilyticum sp.]|nr:DUF2634 domain-containing protein [Cellulosilyticum sp.]